MPRETHRTLTKQGVARTLSPDVRFGPRGLRSLGPACASPSMASLAGYAARGHGPPLAPLTDHSQPVLAEVIAEDPLHLEDRDRVVVKLGVHRRNVDLADHPR